MTAIGQGRALARGVGPFGLWSSTFAALPPGELATAAKRLEELGFGALWIPESTWADPFATAALALAATEGLRVATGVVRIHGRAPQMMANAWQALSGWFPDRFVLGLGVSHQAVIERTVPHVTYDKPLSAMRDYLDALAKAPFHGLPAGSAPSHIVLAALAPKMLALSAERAAGAHPYCSPVSHTAEARRILGPDPLLAPEVRVLFETDAEKARSLARRVLPLRLPNYANNLIRSGFDAEDVRHVADNVVDALVLWGDDETIRQGLQAHLDAGADHLAVQLLTEDEVPAPYDLWERVSAMLRDR